MSMAAVRLRPLRRSGGFALLVGLMWLVSANYHNNLGYLLTYWLVGLGLTAAWHTRRQLVGLEVRSLPPRPVFAGEETDLPLRVRETAGRPRWRVGVEVDGAGAVDFSLPADGEERVSLPWTAPRRGVHRIAPPRLVSSFPLGLFRSVRRLSRGWEVCVYPRPAAEAPPPRGMGKQDETGEREFQGVRRYRPGDTLRQIHWKGLAKGQGLLTKEFVEVGGGDAPIFDWERLPPAGTEERLAWLARWLVDAERGGQPYGLRLPGRFVAPNRGPHHLHACLEQLARFHD